MKAIKFYQPFSAAILSVASWCHGYRVAICHRCRVHGHFTTLWSSRRRPYCCRAHGRSTVLWPSHCRPPSLQSSWMLCSAMAIVLPSAIAAKLIDALQCCGRCVAICCPSCHNLLWMLCLHLPSIASSFAVTIYRGYRISVCCGRHVVICHRRLLWPLCRHLSSVPSPSPFYPPMSIHLSPFISINTPYIFVIFVLIHTLSCRNGLDGGLRLY